MTGGTNRFAVNALDLVEGGVDNLEVFGRADWRATLSKLVQLSWGLDIQHAQGDLWYEGPHVPQGEGNPNKMFTRDRFDTQVVDEKGAVWFRPAAYAETTVTPVKALALTAGVRSDYFSDVSKWTVDPRFSARYVLGATTLKAGIGHFSHPTKEEETMKGFGNPNLTVQQAMHYSLGAEHQLNERVSFGLEGYYKSLDQMIVEAPSQMKENTGRGRITARSSRRAGSRAARSPRWARAPALTPADLL